MSGIVGPANWYVSHLGSREYYIVARSLLRRGRLKRLYTDIWADQFLRPFRSLPGPFRLLNNRYSSDIPDSYVKHFFTWAATQHWEKRFLGKKLDIADTYRDLMKEGQQFSIKVGKSFEREKLADNSIFFAFSNTALESFQTCKKLGISCVLDQIDPGPVEEDMIHEEHDRWPGWDRRADRIPKSYYDRLQQEWESADVIIVNSEWSKSCLEKHGVPTNRMKVVPLAFEPPDAPAPRLPHNKPLTVLWLSMVILRKGFPYLVEAARLLEKTNIRFVVAGEYWLSDNVLASLPANVEMLGRVTPERKRELFATSDVFLLPTISEGFAMTQLEAMSSGMPVITTPNCGRVVTHGKDGFIVPIRDPARIADALLHLDRDRELLASMSAQAIKRSTDFSIDHYGQNLLDAWQRRHEPS